MQLELLLFGLVAALATRVASLLVHEANIGEMVILPCPSSQDADHRFLYWQIGEDKVIGPGNPYNTNKYHYEVWSGRLFIKSIASSESGVYKCFSKHISNSGLNVQAIELIVKRDWEDVYEEDPSANTYRAVISILVVLILILAGGMAYFVKVKRTRNFNDLTREESPEEGPSNRGPLKAYNPTTIEKSKGANRSLDNAIVETDIKTSFSLTDYP